MTATDGFIIAVPKCKLVARTNDIAGWREAYVVGCQFHTAVDLTCGIHAV